MASERTGLFDSRYEPNQDRRLGDGSYSSFGAPQPSAPISEVDQPPSYNAVVSENTQIITCQVCTCMIDISMKREQRVVKCDNCKEATPIQSPPSGKKYVRCPCKCLLICNANAEKISCPRNNCKRIITLHISDSSLNVPRVPGMCQILCGHCNQVFLFNILNNSLALCPMCHRVSSIGPHHSRQLACRFFILACILFLMLILVISFTASIINNHPGIYAAYVAVIIILSVLVIRAIYLYRMKVSCIETA